VPLPLDRQALNRQPAWLRNEWSYRLYVRGLRLAVLGGAVAAVCGWLVASHVKVAVAGVLLGLATGFVSVVCGIVGWIALPDKNRAVVDQGAFLRMVGHDFRVVRTPSGPAPRTLQDLADQMRPPDGG
jgi:hypothetical protein